MKIVFVYDERGSPMGASRQRCRALAAVIHRYSRWSAAVIASRDFAENQPAAAAHCASADLIVVQRGLFGAALSAAQRWKALDKVLAVDLDEAYYLMPNGASKYNAPLVEQLRRTLQLVHAVIAASPRLADDWSGLAPVYTLPQYPELGRLENFAPAPGEELVLGWWGGSAQVEGFISSGLCEALGRVCAARPRVQVLLGEPAPYAVQRVRVAPDQIRPWQLVSGEADYPFLSQVDIALAPACGPYDERRAAWHLLAVMAMRIPWLASDAAPYWELRSYGRLVRNRPRLWESALFQTIDEIEARRAFAAGSPYIYALSQGLEVNAEKVLSVYQTVVRKARRF